ncbi:MAG: ASCH domain-containing protein [Gammaproteobacteria bacterium]
MPPSAKLPAELPVEFLAGCQRVLPADVKAGELPTRSIGRTADLCERLSGYVVARQKTGVFSQPDDFPGGRLPRPGEYAVLVNFSGEPRCLVRYDECTVLPFHAVGPEHVEVETAALRTVAGWRKLHRDYWEPVLAARGESFSNDMPIVFQRFTALYPPAPQSCPGALRSPADPGG